MKNVTITLPDELAHQAKIFAAEHNTSVSRYVGSLLAERLDAEQGYQKSLKRWKSRKPRDLNASAKKYPDRESLYER